MAIEISPRARIKLPSWTIIIGIILLILLIGLIAVYSYFEFSLKKMSKELEERNIADAPLEKAIAEKEAELEPINQKIDDFNTLLAGHKKTLDIFIFLEKICLSTVWFSDFSFENGEINLSAEADNFTTLEQQIDILEKEPLLTSSNITGVSLGEEGKIIFNLSLIFK